jgi:phosphatidylserine decarboxylase
LSDSLPDVDFITHADLTARWRVLPQYLMPRHSLTRLAGVIANRCTGACARQLINWFIRRYGVNMEEALNADPAYYANFNDFFSRALKPGVRPMADATWVSPVDGAISQLGNIQRDQIFQAKGHHYSSTALLGGDAALATQFQEGHFATLYLSPRDYHRIHMPCAGQLRRMVYVPGDLFSVNPTTACAVPGLFARNERVVCIFDTLYGPMAMVLVGATIVGSMATTWHGIVNPPRTKEVRAWHYDGAAVSLEQGAEMGRFLLGSTVVLLFPKGRLQFNPAWQPGGAVRLGQSMGQLCQELP